MKYLTQGVLLAGATIYAATLVKTEASHTNDLVGHWTETTQANMAPAIRRVASHNYDVFGFDKSRKTEGQTPREKDSTTPTLAATTPIPTPKTPIANGTTSPAKKWPTTYIIDFTATWCGPCKRQKPIMDDLRAKGYTVYEVDIDQHPSLAKSWGVSSIPAVFVVRDNRIVGAYTGVTEGSILQTDYGALGVAATTP